MHKEKRKQFFDFPEYPGGKKAFIKYIENHLKYPLPALNNRIEGIVYLEYKVDSNGKVSQVHIEKGIGFGCDEEACRLIKTMQFGSVKNKGFKVTKNYKAKILFKLPVTTTQIKYEYKKDDSDSNQTIQYTIKLTNY